MSKPEVIIVKKKHRGGHGHHGGAWKVAYADFVTAMMAFFLVMWIVGQSKAVRAGVAGYFRDPGVLEHQRSTGILPGGERGLEADAPPPAPPPPAAELDGQETKSMAGTADRLRKMLNSLPEFKQLAAQIQINATADGLRIELVDSSSATFFDSASAVLKPATIQILALIARELAPFGRPLVVEGHTDSLPYPKGVHYTNWELSADRANAARREMERAGLPPELVRAVRGFADRQLVYPAEPLDARNRRVSILVVRKGSEEKRTVMPHELLK